MDTATAGFPTRVGNWTLSVLHHGSNFVAFATWEPNPLCSAWSVHATMAEAMDQVRTWENEIRGK